MTKSRASELITDLLEVRGGPAPMRRVYGTRSRYFLYYHAGGNVPAIDCTKISREMPDDRLAPPPKPAEVVDCMRAAHDKAEAVARKLGFCLLLTAFDARSGEVAAERRVLMHREDWERALKAIKKEEERRKNIEL